MTTNQSDWFTQMQSLVESTARSVQAMADDTAEFKLLVMASLERADIERQELRQAMTGIANLVSSLDSDRPTILRKLNTIENKVDQLLSRGDGDQPHQS